MGIIGSLIAQVKPQLYPISKIETSTLNGRMGVFEVDTLKLPFFDDFSTKNQYNGQLSSLWLPKSGCRINNSMCVNQPTVNVLTFDGVDSTGKPYDSYRLAFGLADQLVSKPIDLSKSSSKSNIILSFFYQKGGVADYPDAVDGDSLQVFFKGSFLKDTLKVNPADTTKTLPDTILTSKWIKVKSFKGIDKVSSTDNQNNPTVFNFFSIKVDSSIFFNKRFQFSIKNYSRLSGNYDNWHIDYVYLDSNRTLNDSTLQDRALLNYPTSLLKNYAQIPFQHFKKIGDQYWNEKSTILVNNMEEFSNVTPYFEFSDAKSNVVLKTVNGEPNIVNYFEKKAFELNNPKEIFDSYTDSVNINLKTYITTGDLSTSRFNLNLLANDTIISSIKMNKSYAYDDGTAEWGYGINQVGSKIAYKYFIKLEDTITSVDISFLKNWKDLTYMQTRFRLSVLTELKSFADKSATLFEKVYPVKFSKFAVDSFSHYEFDVPVIVKDSFYLVLEQTTNDIVQIGYDQSSDVKSADKIFYNVDGNNWILNEFTTNDNGNLMFRPNFGHMVNGQKRIESDYLLKDVKISPNPSNGMFKIDKEGLDKIEVFDLSGRVLWQEEQNHETDINLSFLNNGTYLIRFTKGERFVNKRINISK